MATVTGLLLTGAGGCERPLAQWIYLEATQHMEVRAAVLLNTDESVLLSVHICC